MTIEQLEHAYENYDARTEPAVLADLATRFERHTLAELDCELTPRQRRAIELMSIAASRMARARWAIEHGMMLNFRGAIRYCAWAASLDHLIAIAFPAGELHPETSLGICAQCGRKTSAILMDRLVPVSSDIPDTSIDLNELEAVGHA